MRNYDVQKSLYISEEQTTGEHQRLSPVSPSFEVREDVRDRNTRVQASNKSATPNTQEPTVLAEHEQLELSQEISRL